MNPTQASTLIWFLVLIGVFYFFLIRPQQRRTKEHQKLVDSLKVGDKVVTIGGMYGTIKSLSEKTALLEIAKGVKILVSKTAISRKQ